jgi:PDDEXK-like domain of unknown function (DUF3799)
VKISEPGIYAGVSTEVYLADGYCPAPSFSQSIGKVIIAQSLAHARAAHPILRREVIGPDGLALIDEDETERYDSAKAIGNAWHLLMLDRGKQMQVFDAPNWSATGMGKGAKTQLLADRAAAIEAGLTPILAEHHGTAIAMYECAVQQLAEHGIEWPRPGGNAEVMIAWQEDGCWFRQLLDWLDPAGPGDSRVVWDLKSTKLSVAPQALPKLMGDAGWAIQAAMAARGLAELEPNGRGRLTHRFVAQEQYPPYELTVSDLPESTMTFGHKELNRAIDLWKHAILANRWPGYPRQIQQPTYPDWQQNRMLEREIEAEEQRRAVESRRDVPTDILKAY